MVKSSNEARQEYEDGINRIGGADPYQRAARTSSPSEAAEILEDAKSQNLNVSDMASAFENAY